MPSNTLGFSGQEIVDRVVNYVGSTTTTFRTYVEQTLPLAEFRFCKMHPWRFLWKQNLSLACTSGTNTYNLETGTIGFYMSAEDVETIYDSTNGRVLAKTTVKDLRRLDPEVNDGSSSDELTHWAPVADNQIMVYPSTFANVTLKVDGKITPGALTTLSNFPTIPYRYQESFIEYVIALALDRENDDRAAAKKQEAIALIMQDIKDDVRSQGDVDHARVRSWAEANVDGVGGGDTAEFYIRFLFWG